MSDGELPDGWSCQRLRELIPVQYGKAMKESDRKAGEVPVYGSGGVVGTHNSALTSAHTIVIGRKGSVGSVFFSPRPCWPIDTTYFVSDFGPFEPAFLYHALKSLDLAHLDTSSAIPGLNRDDLYDQDIPLPPLAEQQRIVAKVEALLARVNAARQRLAKAPAILKRFRQSVLAAACSGRLTADWREEFDPEDDALPAAWKERPLSEVCTAFEYGSSKKSEKTGKIPVLRMGNIQDGEIDWSDLVYSNDDDEIAKYSLKPNTVLFNRTNSPELSRPAEGLQLGLVGQ